MTPRGGEPEVSHAKFSGRNTRKPSQPLSRKRAVMRWCLASMSLRRSAGVDNAISADEVAARLSSVTLIASLGIRNATKTSEVFRDFGSLLAYRVHGGGNAPRT